MLRFRELMLDSPWQNGLRSDLRKQLPCYWRRSEGVGMWQMELRCAKSRRYHESTQRAC
jgi:hypothetical protein